MAAHNGNATYLANRKRLLADSPLCHWCNQREATAADHLVEPGRGGSHELDNLVPSCKPCNSRRGQAYGVHLQREQTANPTPIRKKEVRTDVRFLGDELLPPQDIYPIYPNGLNELARTGHDMPRLVTTTASGQKSAVTDIGDFAKEVLGVDLMPWQKNILHGLTSMDSNGDYLHRVGLVSVARQNGKTVAIAALVGWWLTTQGKARGQAQTVITVAHKLDLATALFTYLAPVLASKFNAHVSWSYGRMVLTMPDNSVWFPRAATPQAGHGYSVDLVVADEVWDISEAAIDEGLLPSQRARKNPLFVMMSTAGTQDSKAMLRWREQGLRAIDSGEQTKLYFAEYSPPPSIDLMTPEAWAYANPALGHTLEMSVIEAESEAPNRNAFLRASVNTWTATQNGWLEPGVFEALKSDDPIPPGGILAIEVDTDGAQYVGVRAVQVGLKTAVTVAFVAGTLAETWRLVEAEIALAPTLRVAITPGLEIHLPPNMERRKTIVGYRELLKWTSPVKNMILENRIYHHGENQLIEHVERAVLIKHQGSVALSSTRSPGPITLARCMVWAAALASKPQLVGKPLVVTLNR